MYFHQGKNGTQFNYNSDFSGDIIIQNPDGRSFEIDGKDLLAFVAYCYVSVNMVRKIEYMSVDELLGGGNE